MKKPFRVTEMEKKGEGIYEITMGMPPFLLYAYNIFFYIT
jgi:hypothetical protein